MENQHPMRKIWRIAVEAAIFVCAVPYVAAEVLTLPRVTASVILAATIPACLFVSRVIVLPILDEVFKGKRE